MPAESGRVVIDASDLWRPLEERSRALRSENRRRLDSRRAIAYLIDRALLAFPSVVALEAFGEGGWLVATALMLAYFFVWESLTGQTAGKRIMGLRVVRLDGGPLNVAAIATRNVLLLVDQVVGVFFIVSTPRRQRLGDLIAGTVVTAADDHRHVPASERFGAWIVAGYPLVWVGAALIAASLAHRDAVRARYLEEANLACVNARRAFAVQPNPGLVEWHASVTDVERALRALKPPAGMRGAHARLVAGTHRERALLGRAVRAPRRELPRLAARYRAMAERDGRVARADGFAGCS